MVLKKLVQKEYSSIVSFNPVECPSICLLNQPLLGVGLPAKGQVFCVWWIDERDMF